MVSCKKSSVLYKILKDTFYQWILNSWTFVIKKNSKLLTHDNFLSNFLLNGSQYYGKGIWQYSMQLFFFFNVVFCSHKMHIFIFPKNFSNQWSGKQYLRRLFFNVMCNIQDMFSAWYWEVLRPLIFSGLFHL